MQARLPPRSPRRLKSQEARDALKAEDIVKYTFDKSTRRSDFAKVVKSYQDEFTKLNSLVSAIKRAGQGSTLVFVTSRGTVKFDSKDLKSMQAGYKNSLNDLKKYYLYATKRSGSSVKQLFLGDYSSNVPLKGVYIPVYGSEALQAWIQSANFGTVSTAAGDRNLGDLLTLAKQGVMLRNSTTLLFYIHARVNGLQAPPNPNGGATNGSKNRADTSMKNLFGATFSSIAAEYPATGAIKYTKGANPEAQIFNPNFFNGYFYQVIAARNYTTLKALSTDTNPDVVDLVQKLNSDDYRKVMFEEHKILAMVSMQANAVKKQAQADAKLAGRR